MITVVLATGNAGKAAELGTLLRDLPLRLVSVAEVLGQNLAVAETGDTFEANAIEKALAVSRATCLPALADDSGLEVDALAGQPGVRSARYAHERATDAENNAALLRALEEVEDRRARFRCVLAFVSPWADEPLLAEGRCEGSISRSHRGSGGFGYDPLFLVEGGEGLTMAELSEAEKNEVSHRARAIAALIPKLGGWLDAQRDEVERAFGGG